MGRNRDDNLKVGIEYDVDTASLNQAASSAAQVSEGLDGIAASNERLQASAQATSASFSDQDSELRQLRRRFDQTGDSIDEMTDDLRRATSELQDFESAEGRALRGAGGAPSTGGLDTGGRATRVRDIGGGVAALGNEQFERLTFVAADIADAGQALTELAPGLLSSKTGLLALGAAGVAVGVGFAALTALFNDMTEKSQRAADAERQRLNILRESAQLAAQGETAQEALNRSFQAGIDVEAASSFVEQAEQALRESVDQIGGRISVDPLFDPMTSSIEDVEEIVGRFVSLAGGGGPEAAAALADLEALRQARNDEATAIERQNQATEDADRLLGGQNEAMADARREADLFIQTQQLLANSTADSVRSIVRDNETLIQAREDERDALQAIDEPSAAVQARLFELGVEIDNLQAESESLIPVIDQLTESEKARAAALEQQEIALEMQRVGNELAKQEALEAFEAEQEGAEKLSGLQERMIQSRLAREEEALADAEETAKKRADIEKKLADQIISITQKAADAARETRLDLERELSDLQTSGGRDLTDIDTDARREALEIAIDDQRDSEKSLRQHLRRMQKLRADSEVKEAELIQARDFRGLFNLRRQNRRQLENESTAFTDQERERQIALANERSDLARHTALARADRLLALKQEISDTQLAAARRLGDINRQRNLELSRLQQSANEQLALLSRTESAKVAIVQQGAAATKAALSGMFSANRANAFRSAFASGSRVNITDKSTNTFNTGANPKDVISLVDSRIVRNLSRVIKK